MTLTLGKTVVSDNESGLEADVIQDTGGINRLAVDAVANGGSGSPSINRQDINAALTASGTTAALETAGLAALSCTISVTAVSGTGPVMIVYVQSSDDGTNWTDLTETFKITAASIQRFPAVRILGRYYRLGYTISGTTPSFTVVATSTLKGYKPDRNLTFNRYLDIDLLTLDAVSSVFRVGDCQNISLHVIRTSDDGNNAVVAIEASNDGLNFAEVTSGITTTSGSIHTRTLSAQAFRAYRLKVTQRTAVGTAPSMDLFWSANGGA